MSTVQSSLIPLVHESSEWVVQVQSLPTTAIAHWFESQAADYDLMDSETALSVEIVWFGEHSQFPRDYRTCPFVVRSAQGCWPAVEAGVPVARARFAESGKADSKVLVRTVPIIEVYGDDLGNAKIYVAGEGNTDGHNDHGGPTDFAEGQTNGQGFRQAPRSAVLAMFPAARLRQRLDRDPFIALHKLLNEAPDQE